MALLKVNKALSVLIEETTLRTVDDAVTYLGSKYDIDDEVHGEITEFLESFKVAVKEKMSAEAAAIAKGSKGKRGKKDGNTSSGEEKQKRAPSAYNLYVQKKMAEYKLADETMSAKDRMTKASGQWKMDKMTGQDLNGRW